MDRSLRVKFVESICPFMAEEYLMGNISLDDALHRAETMSNKQCVTEDALRFYLNNRADVENDSFLLYSICVYFLHTGDSYKGEPIKQDKLRNLVFVMLSRIAESECACLAYEKYYHFFNGNYSWMTDSCLKFAAYAMLAYALTSRSLSIYDTNVIDELSRKTETENELTFILRSIVAKAPFAVGCYFDVRPEHDTIELEDSFKAKTLEQLKSLLASEQCDDVVKQSFIRTVEECMMK